VHRGRLRQNYLHVEERFHFKFYVWELYSIVKWRVLDAYARKEKETLSWEAQFMPDYKTPYKKMKVLTD